MLIKIYNMDDKHEQKRAINTVLMEHILPEDKGLLIAHDILDQE